MLVPCAKILHIIECAANAAAYNITWVHNVGIIGDQFAHSVADDLNKYYKQFRCMETPKLANAASLQLA